MSIAPTTSQRSRRRSAALLSAILAIAAALIGDLSMVAIAAGARAVWPEQSVSQWLGTSLVIGLGSYVLFGETQLAAWRREGAEATPLPDRRSRVAGKWLMGGKAIGFIAASLLGGPLVIGWHVGRQRHPRARLLTAASAGILAIFWSAVYLGLLGAIL